MNTHPYSQEMPSQVYHSIVEDGIGCSRESHRHGVPNSSSRTSRDASRAQASDSPPGRGPAALPRVRKRTDALPRHQAAGAVDQFRTGRSAAPTTMVSALRPAISPCRHRLTRRRSVATFGPAEEVDLLSYVAARELGHRGEAAGRLRGRSRLEQDPGRGPLSRRGENPGLVPPLAQNPGSGRSPGGWSRLRKP